MIKLLTGADITYICRSMMGVDWLPSFIDIPSWVNHQRSLVEQEGILRTLSLCQSKLEVMYFLGIGYYLHANATRWGGVSEDYPPFYPAEYEGQRGVGIAEPFVGGRWGNGFSSLLVIPQYHSPEKPIHHDFGFFTAPDNGGGPPWYFHAAIEIEGYGVHKQRRAKDEARYAGLSYKVISVYEEMTSPLNWYELFDPDVNEALQHDDEEAELEF